MNDDLDLKQHNIIGDDFSDDLLNDLQELDEITDDMQESVSIVKETQHTVNNTDSATTIDAATIALETAKISQQSAESSHNAIDAAIKLSHAQKKQAFELADSNIAWRNSVSKANKQIASGKSTMAIMLVISIIISLLSISIIGYLYYSLNKKNETMKGEMLDIIATELSLSGKKSEMKLDQLVSLIESINIRSQSLTTTVKDESKLIELEKPINKETIVAIDNSSIKQQLADFNQHQTLQMLQMQDIETILAKINQSQIALSARKDSPKITPPIKVTAMGLTESQLKKINNISWAIHKQGKILKEIQRKFNTQSNSYSNKKPAPQDIIKNLLIEINQRVNKLQQQQTATQKQIKELQQATKNLSRAPKLYQYPTSN